MSEERFPTFGELEVGDRFIPVPVTTATLKQGDRVHRVYIKIEGSQSSDPAFPEEVVNNAVRLKTGEFGNFENDKPVLKLE